MFVLILLYILITVLIITGLITLGVIVYVVTNIFYVIFVTKVPPVQTAKKYFGKILAQVNITPKTVIYDLGCGGGNLLLAASKFKPRLCVGYELSFWPYASAAVKAWLFGEGRMEIYRRDFFGANLSPANVVFVYLVPPVLERVADKLKRDLKRGSVVLVKGLPLPGLTIDSKVCLDDKRDYWLYKYIF